MKTIRQIADELGVSKTAVNKQIANQSQTKTQTENHEVCDLVCVLRATIDTLQEQLEVKDRQIEQQAQTIARLTDALIAAQQTAAAAQALHAGSLQQLGSKKVHWWQRKRGERE